MAKVTTFHRVRAGEYRSDCGRYHIQAEYGISAGWDTKGNEKFQVDGWVLYDEDHNTLDCFRTLKDAKHACL